MRRAGGCLCGRVRFAISHLPKDVADYCHCRQCRRATGAPVAAWLQVASARFALEQGAPRAFASSPGATRWFCGDCGSPLYMTDGDERSVGVLLGALDEPERVKPTVHGWTSAQLGWLEIADDLPRFPREPPYDR